MQTSKIKNLFEKYNTGQEEETNLLEVARNKLLYLSQFIPGNQNMQAEAFMEQIQNKINAQLICVETFKSEQHMEQHTKSYNV